MNKIKPNKLPSHIQFDTVSPATKLLEKRRKMYEVHEAFESQKEEFKKQEVKFKKQEQQIRERDLAIQADLINFCKFLQDNEAKKQRAEKRLLDEQKDREKKEKEIQELNLCKKQLLDHQDIFEKKLKQLNQFQEYLEKVQKAYPDQYTDLGDILIRYKTLIDSNERLVNEHKKTEEEYESLKNHSIQIDLSFNHEILQLNNDIKELQKKLEDKTNEKNFLQSKVESSTNETSTKNLNLGRILQAIENLYDRCQEGTSHKIRFQNVEETKTEAKKNEQKEPKLEKEKDKRKNLIEKKIRYDMYGDYEHPEDDFDFRTKQAVAKLKTTATYMNEFKKILEGMRIQISAIKDQKKQNLQQN